MDDHDRITYFAQTTHRNAGGVFGIRQRDRRSHVLIVGKTGTGKTHILKLMMEQDLKCGCGFLLIDPHGDLYRDVRSLARITGRREIISIDLTDSSLRWRFNPIAGVPEEKIPHAVAGLIEVFAKLWPDVWGPRLEHLLRNVLFTLFERPGSTLADVLPLLGDRDFRRDVVSRVSNPIVRSFWSEEYDRYSPAFRAVVTAPLLNKLGAILTDPLLCRFFTESGRQLDIRGIMDRGYVLLANLEKGQIGESPCVAIGSFLLSHVALASLSRSNQPEADRRDYTVYADEFHNFTTLSVVTFLAELRKFRTSIVVASQFLAQTSTQIRDALFGNVGTLIAFRVGAADASYLAREFSPRIGATDLIALPKYHIYLRLLIDGEASPAFSAVTLPSPRN